MLKDEIDSLAPSRDFSRRSFVQTTVGSGFAAAAEPKEAHGGEGAPVQTFKRDQPKVGRNDACPCGSGKKYKKCHGAA